MRVVRWVGWSSRALSPNRPCPTLADQPTQPCSFSLSVNNAEASSSTAHTTPLASELDSESERVKRRRLDSGVDVPEEVLDIWRTYVCHLHGSPVGSAPPKQALCIGTHQAQLQLSKSQKRNLNQLLRIYVQRLRGFGASGHKCPGAPQQPIVHVSDVTQAWQNMCHCGYTCRRGSPGTKSTADTGARHMSGDRKKYGPCHQERSCLQGTAYQLLGHTTHPFLEPAQHHPL